jgi:hypothetical protein
MQLCRVYTAPIQGFKGEGGREGGGGEGPSSRFRNSQTVIIFRLHLSSSFFHPSSLTIDLHSYHIVICGNGSILLWTTLHNFQQIRRITCSLPLEAQQRHTICSPVYQEISYYYFRTRDLNHHYQNTIPINFTAPKMCGIRECMGILQWMTGGKATKHDDGSADENGGHLGPRKVGKGQDGKWDVEEKGKGEKPGSGGR